MVSDLPPPTTPDAGLRWLSRVLWGPSSDVTVRMGRPGEHDFIVLPTTTHPRLVVPAGDHGTAARTLMHAGGGQRRARRVARRAMAGVAGLVVHAPLPVPVLASSSPSRLREPMQTAHPTAVGFGIRLGPTRPNLKPVLLVADEAGDLVGIGKVGWSPLTTGLVRNGAHLPSLDDDAVVAPRSRRLDDLGDIVVDWQDALPLHGLADVIDPEVLVAGMRAIVGDTRTAVLDDSDYADRLRRSGDRLGLRDCVDLVLERHADRALDFGRWHGDLNPWNVGQLDGRLAVWDWERWEDDVPAGFDALHWHLPLGQMTTNPTARRDSALAASLDHLDRLGIPRDSARALSDLHLLELLLRFHPALPAVCRGLREALGAPA